MALEHEQSFKHLFSHLQCTDCLMSGLAVMYVYELESVSCSAPFNQTLNGKGSAGSLRCALLYQAIRYKARSKWKLKASSVRGSFYKSDLKEANIVLAWNVQICNSRFSESVQCNGNVIASLWAGYTAGVSVSSPSINTAKEFTSNHIQC